ncbi:MAG: FAD-dependent thymidylate synthase [Anaerolineaceae bacterium]|nr:FAD-dependent thymidylate synthase [Anaerolineaceae bacterium]
MPVKRRVYRLSPSQLSAETIAVTFAKTSRSPKPFDEIALELNDEKAARFSEKWIVGYGHSSVAEHAVLHLALENVSRLAIETIESNRLASYTEKSTRYQEWDKEAFVVPEEIQGARLESIYYETLNTLFDAYEQAIPRVQNWVSLNHPQLPDEKEKEWSNRVRTTTIDVCRFLLPAASMANVGVTINARALEYAIRKMLSSDLAEVRQIGAEVKAVATQELPTLVKYATPIENYQTIKNTLKEISFSNKALEAGEWCQLLQIDPLGEDKVLSALLYRFGQGSFGACETLVSNMELSEKQGIIKALFEGANPFDVPLRELEYTSYLFDIVMDQGAYFEFKRHRMMSQTPQILTAQLGFAIPRAISVAGFEEEYIGAMRKAAETYERIFKINPMVASYIVPNGFNRRVLFKLNLRELFHFLRLRCNSNSHFSIRRVGRAMMEKIQPTHPIFSQFLQVDCTETVASISKEYFSDPAMF